MQSNQDAIEPGEELAGAVKAMEPFPCGDECFLSQFFSRCFVAAEHHGLAKEPFFERLDKFAKCLRIAMAGQSE